jgi:hypothetical protein
MLWFYAKQPAELVWEDGGEQIGWDPRKSAPKPASPYYSDPRLVPPDEIFDRDTDERVPISALQAYADTLRKYHRSPETKFLGGGPADVGPLHRRHVAVGAVNYIGKEADSFEEAEEFGAGEEDVTLYGPSPADRAKMVAVIAAAPVRALKTRAKVGHSLIAKAAAGDVTVKHRTLNKLYRAAVEHADEVRQFDEADAELCEWAREWAELHKIAELARRIGHDPSNLATALHGGKLGKALSKKVKGFRGQLEAMGIE